jgi:hypothetical protein
MYEVSQRHWNSIVRTTHFIEIGPITGLHRSTFANLLPFQQAKMGYGLDLYWSEIARANDWNIGVIDASPISHLRPIAAAYDQSKAIEEAQEFLRQHGVARKKEEILCTLKTIYNVRPRSP